MIATLVPADCFKIRGFHVPHAIFENKDDIAARGGESLECVWRKPCADYGNLEIRGSY